MRNRIDSDTDDSYQVDAVVSLFAVLLVMLIVLAAAIAATEGTSRLDYQILDPDGDEMALRSIEVPYKNVSIWVLGGTKIARIDLAAIAKARAATGGQGPSIQRMGDLRVDFTSRAETLGTWRLALYGFGPSSQSEALTDWIDISDQDALSLWAAGEGRVLVYVTVAGRLALPTINASLRVGRRPFRLSLLSEIDSPIIYARRSEGFAYEKTFRAY